MNRLKEYQGGHGREHASTNVNAYRGIPMFCDKGLHETCFRHVAHLPKTSRILVLGSGSGAFDQRLIDAGFSHVTSLDFRPDFFRATGTTFVERDLNQDFSSLGVFDAIIAIELIEHMENPSHFLRNIFACLAPSGMALLTTPNVESGPSPINFLATNTLGFFTEVDMKGSGHISPMLHHIFSFLAENSGLEIASHTYNRSAWLARLQSNTIECIANIKRLSILRAGIILFKTIVLLLLSPLALAKPNDGNIHVYVLRKK